MNNFFKYVKYTVGVILPLLIVMHLKKELELEPLENKSTVLVKVRDKSDKACLGKRNMLKEPKVQKGKLLSKPIPTIYDLDYK